MARYCRGCNKKLGIWHYHSVVAAYHENGKPAVTEYYCSRCFKEGKGKISEEHSGHVESIPSSAPKARETKLTWFYVGVIFTAMFGHSKLGLNDMLPAHKILIIALGVLYCIILSDFVKLALCFGITALLAIAGIVTTIALQQIGAATGINANAAEVSIVAKAALFFRGALLLMSVGLAFHGISRLFARKSIPK